MIIDSGSVNADAGTVKFTSAPVFGEVPTSVLPNTSTAPEINRSTGPTTVLPQQLSLGTTRELAKSKKRKVVLIALITAVVAAIVFAGYSSFRKSSSAIESIAVLPFENRSGSTDADYLSDGLADSLIYRLSQLPNLKVSPTSSVMRYKGKDIDVAQIAKELEVDAVMLGRMAQRGDDLSISVQLIDARTKKLIWAEQYERKLADLLATQREIATSITQKLQLQLATDERGLTKKYTNSNESYQLYLKGRFHYAKRTKDDLNKGIDYFQQAVKLDPNFALAYAMIADSYASMPAYPYLSPKEALPLAKAAAARALEIDPMLPEAHSAMGYALCFSDWNWVEAERRLKRALELDPKNSLAHVRFAIYFLATGQTANARRENETAAELEPLNLVNGANLTWMFLGDGKMPEALAQGMKVHDLEPNFVLGRYQLGLAYNANSMYAEAIALAEQTLQTDPRNQLMLLVAGYAYAKSGRQSDAKGVIDRLKEIRKAEYVISYFVATIYTALDDRENAFVELERAYRERDWRMSAQIKKDFMIEPLRGDRRYAELLRRMNLTE